ncbi:MAG: adenine phosphoribosyltransferase, partial [Acidimicrobiia bacterium]
DIPDFPEPGVVFKDITPVLADPEALSQLIEALARPFKEAGVSKVAGIEARGFTLATPVANQLEAGFIPLRKPGKLPYDTVREDYDLEYGTDALEVHVDAVTEGERVLLVDDVIATGGTAAAAIRLLRGIGAEVVGLSVFIELVFLGGSDHLDGVPLHALLRYD